MCIRDSLRSARALSMDKSQTTTTTTKLMYMPLGPVTEFLYNTQKADCVCSIGNIYTNDEQSCDREESTVSVRILMLVERML